MKLIINILLIFLVVSCTPNLFWSGEKQYNPSQSKIYVDGLGINDSVTILYPDSQFVVSRLLNNGGTSAINQVYLVDDKIKRMTFFAVAGTAGFIEQDLVYQMTVPGPQLNAQTADSVFFGVIGPLDCGLYKQIMTADTSNVVKELNENDNAGTHYFLVPSNQNFGLSKTEIITGLPHTAGMIHTTDFNIVAGIDTVWVGHFSFIATEGSTASIDVATPLMIPPFGTQTVKMFVTPKDHKINSGFEPTVTGKLTVISNDGCIIKQKKAKVFIEHEMN